MYNFNCFSSVDLFSDNVLRATYTHTLIHSLTKIAKEAAQQHKEMENVVDGDEQ